MKECIKNSCKSGKEFLKKHKKKIIISISICVVLIIALAGAAYGVAYSKANANIKYSQEEMEKIALAKVPGEVVDTEKELNCREGVYEYEFKIKDKDNLLKEITINSKYGTIETRNKRESHGGDKGRRGENKNNKLENNKNQNNKDNVENGED